MAHSRAERTKLLQICTQARRWAQARKNATLRPPPTGVLHQCGWWPNHGGSTAVCGRGVASVSPPWTGALNRIGVPSEQRRRSDTPRFHAEDRCSDGWALEVARRTRRTLRHGTCPLGQVSKTRFRRSGRLGLRADRGPGPATRGEIRKAISGRRGRAAPIRPTRPRTAADEPRPGPVRNLL